MSQELSFEEKYKRMEAFHYLKNGKQLIRRGLLKRIFFLSLKRQVNIFRSQTLVDHDEFDRLNIFKINLSDLEFKEFKLACDYYLQNNLVSKTHQIANEFYFFAGNFIKILYKKQNVRWDLLDYDLISLYPDNIVIKNKIPYIKNYNVYPLAPDYRFTNAANLSQRREEKSPSV
jgi:hypothetical protein